MKKSRSRYLAIVFINNADKTQYGDLQTTLANDFTLRQDKYPDTLGDAYEVLCEIKRTSNPGRRITPMFHQQELDDEDSGLRGRGRSGGTGRGGGRGGGTGRGGNISRAESGTQDQSGNHTNKSTNNNNNSNAPYPFAYSDAVLLNSSTSSIDNNWVILDSASGIDLFKNPALVSDISHSDQNLNVLSHGGTRQVNKTARVAGYPSRVWFDPNGVANIIALKNLRKYFDVSYDSRTSDTFEVYDIDGTHLMTFKPWIDGLWYYDTSGTGSGESKFSLVTTVEGRKRNYTPRGVKQAESARRAQDIMMRPPSKKLQKILSRGQIHNCPITSGHVKHADDIFGPNLGALKGKTVRKNVPSSINPLDPVPDEVLERYPSLSLGVDILYVNSVPFLVGFGRELKGGHAIPLPSRHVNVVGHALKRILNGYTRRGFRIAMIYADEEFTALEGEVKVDGSDDRSVAVPFDFAARDDHIPEVERFNRTIKDSVRSAYNVLPFTHVPKTVVRHLVLNAVFWWNALPNDNSPFDLYSNHYILHGVHTDFVRHVRSPFGSYVQTHKEHDNSISDHRRSLPWTHWQSPRLPLFHVFTHRTHHSAYTMDRTTHAAGCG